MTFNKGMYFWLATRAVLPESWRWFSHTLNSGGQGSIDDLGHTAQAAMQRVDRVLKTRDALRWHLTLRQNNDVADDALAQVDHILVDLVGAFDATARVAHRILGLPGEPQTVGWQKNRWLNQVRPLAPVLAAVVAPHSMAADVFEVIRIMRNTVHGAGLQAIGLGDAGGRRKGTAVGLSAADTDLLKAVTQRRSWAPEWGLTEFTPDRVYLEPGAFIEHVVPTSIATINDLMRETPVEVLATGVVANAEPPSDQLDDPFARRHSRSILYQLGFADVAAAHL